MAFPATPLDMTVELFIGGVWTDVTSLVYGRDRLTVTRGGADEGQHVERSTCRATINNRSGNFSPRNPTGIYYGLIGRNTPMRVSLPSGVRFHGEVSEFPQRWDTSGADVYVPIEASGVLRRLAQGSSPLSSAMYRGTTAPAGLVAYWPAEDGADATSIASATGGPAMTLVGTPDLAASTVFASSGPLPELSASQWTGIVPAHTPTSTVQFSVLLAAPSTGAGDDQGIFRANVTGTIQFVDLVYHTGGDLELRVTNSSDTAILTTVHNTNVNGKLVRVVATFTTDGLDVDWTLDVLEVGAAAFAASGTLAGVPLPRVAAMVINPGANLETTDPVVVGHVSIRTGAAVAVAVLQDELDAYAGETAGRRIERLCDEEAVTFSSEGDLDATAAMGPQRPGQLVALLRVAADTDQGILHEPRATFGLAYRTRESLDNQTATLTLDYAAGELSGIEPTDDDQHVRNDITLRRADGGSARAVKETGPLSVLDPPNGVGRYDEELTLNHHADDQLPDHAGWRLHLGTVDEARYPVLSVNLARAPFVADAVLAAACQTLDIGDRLVVENPPAWLPPDDISQLAQGFVETMGNFEHTIDVNCSPESPWGQLGIYDSGDRYSSDGSTVNEALTTTETDVDVATATGPLWSHRDGDFAVVVGGEQMTVTAVSGASSPQTFTVVRSVNGVVKTHAAGAVLELADPAVYAI